MKYLIIFLALSLTACASTNSEIKTDYRNAKIEKINEQK